MALVLLQTEPRILTRNHVAGVVSEALGQSYPKEEIVEEFFPM